jgi:hypothetical protein
MFRFHARHNRLWCLPPFFWGLLFCSKSDLGESLSASVESVIDTDLVDRTALKKNLSQDMHIRLLWGRHVRRR